MSSKSADEFLNEIESLIKNADGKAKPTPSNASVTFNMRINEALKNDFDKLCRENHTNMTAEVKRFIRLAVAKQKL